MDYDGWPRRLEFSLMIEGGGNSVKEALAATSSGLNLSGLCLAILLPGRYAEAG